MGYTLGVTTRFWVTIIMPFCTLYSFNHSVGSWKQSYVPFSMKSCKPSNEYIFLTHIFLCVCVCVCIIHLSRLCSMDFPYYLCLGELPMGVIAMKLPIHTLQYVAFYILCMIVKSRAIKASSSTRQTLLCGFCGYIFIMTPLLSEDLAHV